MKICPHSKERKVAMLRLTPAGAAPPLSPGFCACVRVCTRLASHAHPRLHLLSLLLFFLQSAPYQHSSVSFITPSSHLLGWDQTETGCERENAVDDVSGALFSKTPSFFSSLSLSPPPLLSP